MSVHCGNNLKLIRELFNLKQQYVALIIGVSEKTYRNMEHSEQAPSDYYLHGLSQFYKFDLHHILYLSREDIVGRIIQSGGGRLETNYLKIISAWVWGLVYMPKQYMSPIVCVWIPSLGNS